MQFQSTATRCDRLHGNMGNMSQDDRRVAPDLNEIGCLVVDGAKVSARSRRLTLVATGPGHYVSGVSLV